LIAFSVNEAKQNATKKPQKRQSPLRHYAERYIHYLLAHHYFKVFKRIGAWGKEKLFPKSFSFPTILFSIHFSSTLPDRDEPPWQQE